ncbi:MAG: hypothetical protein JSU96_19235 [Acidobacteriota bacterium]|nr:MAG: hypothetical protein JSU96_19235 [Acidobacteriota bacterium]
MNFHFDKAVSILGQTYPFVILRLLVYVAAVFVTVAWFAGIWFLFIDWPFPGPPWLAWVIGGILYGKGASLVRNYVLYLVKAAHIGVITELVRNGRLPAGSNQFSFGRDIILNHFLRVSILFAVDGLVRVVVRAFNRSVFKLIGFIPGIENLKGFFQKVLDYSLGYVDEAILSYTLTQPERNPWSSAKDGLILYVQNWKTVLGSGFILALISYVVVGVFAAPGVLLAYLGIGPFGKAIAAIFVGLGLLVKFIFMDPFALVSVIVNYHEAIRGQVADPQWSNRLSEVSKKFGDFDKKAKEWGSPSGPPPAPASS